MRYPHRLKVNICCLWIGGRRGVGGEKGAPAESRPDPLGILPCSGAPPTLSVSWMENKGHLDQGYSDHKHWADTCRRKASQSQILTRMKVRKGGPVNAHTQQSTFQYVPRSATHNNQKIGDKNPNGAKQQEKG